MASDLFKRVRFNKLRKGDLIFMFEDQKVNLVLKKGRKLAKLEDVENKRVTWVTSMRFNQREYYYLEK
jgi:hypothetical protein